MHGFYLHGTFMRRGTEYAPYHPYSTISIMFWCSVMKNCTPTPWLTLPIDYGRAPLRTRGYLVGLTKFQRWLISQFLANEFRFEAQRSRLGILGFLQQRVINCTEYDSTRESKPMSTTYNSVRKRCKAKRLDWIARRSRMDKLGQVIKDTRMAISFQKIPEDLGR